MEDVVPYFWNLMFCFRNKCMHVYLGIKQQKHFKTRLEDNGFKRFLKN